MVGSTKETSMDQQEKMSIEEMMNTQRWFLNNGLVPDSVKNQLFFYGSIIHTEVQAVEVKIRPEVKTVDYVVYVNKDLMQKIDTYKKLSTATSLFGLWRFKRFLKKEGSLDFHSMINSFVRDFCGPAWAATVSVADFDKYVDNIGVEGEPAGPQSQQPDQQSY
jgi:hypothetical protein